VSVEITRCVVFQLLLGFSPTARAFLFDNTIHSYMFHEIAIRKQRLAVDQTFNKEMEKFTKLEQAHLHQKVDTIKERASQNEESLAYKKDQGRKVVLQT